MLKRLLGLQLIGFVCASFIFSSSVWAGDVTLRLNTWENPATTKVLEELNQAFEKKYPHIEIEFTHSPRNVFNTENPARIDANDVDIWSDFGFAVKVRDYHPKKVTLPTNHQYILAGNAASLDGQPFLKRFKPEAVKDGMTYDKDGKVYGMTMGSVVFSGIYYNKDIFKKYGLSQPKTYPELIKVSETLKSNGVTPFVAAGGPAWPINMMIFGFMGPLISDPEALDKDLWTGGKGYNTPEYYEALSKYHRLMKNYYLPGFQSLDYNPHIAFFAAGRAAMLPDGIWQASSIAETNPNLNFGYMPIPSSDKAADNQKFYGKYDIMFMVHSKSKVKKEAMLWLDFISEKENYKQFVNATGMLPTQPGVDVKNKLIKEVASYGMKLSFEQVQLVKQGISQYGQAFPQYLTPMGEIQTAQELIDLAMKDWK